MTAPLSTGPILFLTHVGQPGGAEFVMIRLCKAVAGQCRVVHFLNGPLEKILSENDIPSAVIAMPDALSGLKRSSGLPGLLKAVPAMVSMLSAVTGEARKARVVVCMSQKSIAFAALAKIFFRRPVIWFMNDLISPEHFSKPLIFAMTRLFAPFADVIVLNSQASFEAWRQSGGPAKKTIVIYPGSDVAAIDAQLADRNKIAAYRARFTNNERKLVGIFGRISDWKGQDILLEAMKDIPDANIVIVGDAFFGEEAYHRKLQDMTASPALTGRVHFAGHIDDVPCAMAACDVVVHASTLPEPFGLVIVEAMLSGTPVIASKAGGAAEIVVDGETGLMTKPGSSEDLACAVRRLLEDRDAARQMAEKARVRAAAGFSNDAMIKAFRSLLARFS